MKLKIEKEWHFHKVTCEYEVYYDEQTGNWVDEGYNAVVSIKNAIDMLEEQFTSNEMADKPKKSSKKTPEPPKSAKTLRPITDKQISLLKKIYPNDDLDFDIMTGNEASDLITAYYNNKK